MTQKTFNGAPVTLEQEGRDVHLFISGIDVAWLDGESGRLGISKGLSAEEMYNLIYKWGVTVNIKDESIAILVDKYDMRVYE